ncbi:MAG TPA: undecaprenyl diphosphate synthase family protein, partial [Trueperaceae bacterium]
MSPASERSFGAARRALDVWHVVTRPLYWLYERNLARAVREDGALPRHLGLILDGNRRFARAVGVPVGLGHELGARKAREVLEWCLELGIDTVTLWIFSTDNRGRDPQEVAELLELFT